MPVKNAIVHLIDKKPDGSPGIIVLSQAPLQVKQEVDDLVQDLNEAYNAKQSKAWGFFPGESGAYPLTEWLSAYVAENLSFLEFTSEAANHLLRLKEESSLSIGGHVAFIHYVQGMTDYLLIAELGTRQAVAINDSLDLERVDHIDVGAMSAAARINISEWQNNKASTQYISMLASKSKRRSPFAELIGLQEGVDAKSETRTLLKAFSDYVEAQDVTEESARAQTDTLVGYATSQAKLGEPISLEELSELIDEDRPRAFYEHIRNKDYGLSPQLPPDKRTLSMFQRFTGRSDGLSISFEAHLLGSKIEFDEGRGQLIIRNLPQQLQDQLKRAKTQA